jgi:DAK2 domain fusion protein YloV
MTGRTVTKLDAAALARWYARSAEALAVACAGIDALNVFPVADGDTGTNMLLTMQAAATAAGAAQAGGADLADVAEAGAAGSLGAARGSSGVILSRYLFGVAAGLRTLPAGDGASVQSALTAAADAAYAAVNDPVEGTVLSVARAAAKAAREADPDDLLRVTKAAATAAADELRRTTAQLPALAAAGVVDAGGQGLLLVLDALSDTVAGVVTEPVPQIAAASAGPKVTTSPAFAYEVQYLLDAPPDVLPDLRDRLAALGDSVAVVSGADVHNVHVHVDDVGAAIEAALDLGGRPRRISVSRFADETAASRVVALTPAGGLAELFRAAGATAVEVGDDDNLVATKLTAAVCAAGARSVVVLPNARAFRDVADAAASAARLAGRSATVVPTRSPVQGLAALAVHDPGRRADDDAVAMSAAAAATRYAEVTRASFDALTSAGPCRAGDVLGLIDDDVATIGDDVDAVARELLDRMLIGGGELVTIVVGADAPATLGASLGDYLHATRPAVEMVVHDGGHPAYPVMLGVE